MTVRLAGAAILALGLAHQDVDQTARRRVDLGYGASAEGLGVCAIDESKATCWDMAGGASPSLAIRVETELNKPYQLPVTAELGGKNRYLVVLVRRGPFSVDVRPRLNPGLSMGAGEAEHLYLVWEAPPSEDKESSVYLDVSDKEHSPADQSDFRRGATMGVGSRRFGIGPWKEAEPSMPSYPMDARSKWWAITLGGTLPTLRNEYADFDFYGADRKRIEFVDAQGKPIGAAAYRKWVESVRGKPIWGPLPYRLAQARPSQFRLSDAFQLETNVDPRRIASVRVTLVKRRTILLTGFPLDPNGP